MLTFTFQKCLALLILTTCIGTELLSAQAPTDPWSRVPNPPARCFAGDTYEDGARQAACLLTP